MTDLAYLKVKETPLLDALAKDSMPLCKTHYAKWLEDHLVPIRWYHLAWWRIRNSFNHYMNKLVCFLVEHDWTNEYDIEAADGSIIQLCNTCGKGFYYEHIEKGETRNG